MTGVTRAASPVTSCWKALEARAIAERLGRPSSEQHEDEDQEREQDQRQDDAEGHSTRLAPSRGARERRPPAGRDLEQVAHDDEVGEVDDRCIRIAVDGHDGARGLHADLVLDGAADADRDVEGGLDDLARLPDLLGIRQPAGIDDGAGAGDGATEGIREVLDDPEPVRSGDPATASHHDLGVVDGDGGPGRRDALDDTDPLVDRDGRPRRRGRDRPEAATLPRRGRARPHDDDAAARREAAARDEPATERAHLDDRAAIEPGHGRRVDEDGQAEASGDDAGDVLAIRRGGDEHEIGGADASSSTRCAAMTNAAGVAPSVSASSASTSGA